MCYGVARPSGEFSYCNAGQEPPLVIAKDGIRWLETGGPVLGLLPTARYEYETVTLAPGDLVIVCSDGVTEARNVANEEFGRDRMLDGDEVDARRQAETRARPAPAVSRPVRHRRPAGRRHHGAGVPVSRETARDEHPAGRHARRLRQGDRRRPGRLPSRPGAVDAAGRRTCNSEYQFSCPPAGRCWWRVGGSSNSPRPPC